MTRQRRRTERRSRGAIPLLAALGLIAGMQLAAAVTSLAEDRNFGRNGTGAPAGQAEDEVEPEFPGVAYEVVFEGPITEDDDLLDLFKASSRLLALQDKPPATRLQLERRAGEDRERFLQASHSEGYYDTGVRFEIDTSQDPVPVKFWIDPGSRYRFAGFEIRYLSAGDYAAPVPEARPAIEDLGLERGAPARGPAILAAEQSWKRLMAERGHPEAEVVGRKAVIDPERKDMTVTWDLDGGPKRFFGTTEISGQKDVEEEHLRRFVKWQEGEPYDQRKVQETRQAFAESGLFSSISIDRLPTDDPSAPLAMEIAIKEGPPRSIGFGLSFASDTGFGGDVFWEHRNFFGQGERLRAEITAAEIEQSAAVSFRKSHFLRPDWGLHLETTFANETTEAFDELSLAGLAELEIPFLENWLFSLGLAPELLQVEDENGRREFTLLGFPFRVNRDSTDDLLNPTEGSKLEVSVTPFIGGGDSSLGFVKTAANASIYQALDGERRYVLAGRASIGSLVGEQTQDIPAGKRFYAGGGGSVRGYEFQLVGPLDAEGDPLGGRSLMTVNLEARVRVTETIGVVPFLDGGMVTDASYPDFDETFLWAAGLGLRYFTGFGPVRADIAFPLNGRDIDDSFEFYISFGQAF
jgi:translocation and assembly module TamA